MKNNNAVGATMLIGTIKIDGVDGEVWSIDKDTEGSNQFIVTSTRGYENEMPTLDKALKLVRTRIKNDLIDKRIIEANKPPNLRV